jgi:hypothetical protein
MATLTAGQHSAIDALHGSPIPVLRSLRVTETDVEVTISGNVHSFYLKQLAQEAVFPVLGQRRLVNHIEVDSDM